MSAVELDASVPVLLVRTAEDPLAYGALGAARSLGRLGVPVFAMVESRRTPLAGSRYVTGSCVAPDGPRTDPECTVTRIRGAIERIGPPVIALPTDDEAAILLVEHRAALGDAIIVPDIDATLPRELASKSRLAALCRTHRVPCPVSGRPADLAELFGAADEIGYPVVVKNDAAFSRLTHPAVASTTVISTPTELGELARTWSEMPPVTLQEYLPAEGSEDWISHCYIGVRAGNQVIFTGRKVRSWPPRAGVTSYAFAASNERVRTLTERLCRAIGYRGVADLDWRLDPRDGEYKLVDFNPRLGANFRLFERRGGIDVARAMHLDLTGRTVPDGPEAAGRRFIVENLDAPAILAYRDLRPYADPPRRGPIELAWWQRDDMMPALRAARISVRLAARRLPHRLPTQRAAPRARRRARPDRP